MSTIILAIIIFLIFHVLATAIMFEIVQIAWKANVLGAIVGLCFTILLFSIKTPEVVKQPTYIDVPEEWEAISEDKNKPDGVLIHRSKDSLFIQFSKGCIK